MSTEIATQDRSLTILTNDQLKFISNTEFVPPGLRGNVPAILACVATGRSIGISDMTALRSIHVIDGKPTFSAELMVHLVRRDGHSITGEVTEGKATVVGKRSDNGDEMTATWTLEMANRAGLTGKSNWKKYPEAMLWARAVSQLCRMLFADVFAGGTYTTEELGADDTDETGVWSEESGALVGSDDGAQAAEARPGKGPSGPTSALAQFKQKATEAGIPVETMNATAALLFPGRSAQSLTASELDELWERLVGDVRAAVD